MSRLRTAFNISGLKGPLSAKALAKKYGRKAPVHLLELVGAICRKGALSEIKHFFVLVLENRSFDHIFGLSQITGTHAVTGDKTVINGIPEGMKPQLDSNGNEHPILKIDLSAPFALKGDIGHEFPNVKRQLCGVKDYNKAYNGTDQEIDNSGFVLDLETLIRQETAAGKGKGATPDDAMRCFTSEALPVLTKLAKEFAICDNWFSSVPGPTFPNRLFIHAASSDGFTYSPNWGELVKHALFTGVNFDKGHIFDRLDDKDICWDVYVGDRLFNNTVLMDGISITDLSDIGDMAEDINDPEFDGSYVFIEPIYDPLHEYVDGNSMHPLNNHAAAEKLVKDVYEALVRSPCWKRSALVITFDEHGGFFDHVRPPRAVAPGDDAEREPEQDFDFRRLGVRVPAIIVSPLIPKNMIDHTQYDHTSILATLGDRFGLKSLTKRDAAALPFSHLFQLKKARTDIPMTLPEPARPAAQAQESAKIRQPTRLLPDELPLSEVPASIQTFILAAAVADRKARGSGAEPAITAEVANLRTLGDARRYSHEVRARVALHPPVRRPPFRKREPHNEELP